MFSFPSFSFPPPPPFFFLFFFFSSFNHSINQSINLITFQYGLGGLRLRNRQPYGAELALLASVILAGSSVPRALKTQKPLPIGLSIVAAVGLWRFGTVLRG